MSFSHPINIHQQRAKEKVLLLCGFTIDATRKPSPSCLSGSVHTDGSGPPEQTAGRRRHRRLKIHRSGSRCTCHDKPFCGSILQATTLSSALDYTWLCPSINMPQQDAAWFHTDISTEPDLGHCVYLSYISWWQQHQWQPRVIVIVLLPGNRHLTRSGMLLLFKAGYDFAFVLILQHEFQTVWKCREIHLNGVTDRNGGGDTAEAINKSNEYLSLISVTHTLRFKTSPHKKHGSVFL